MMLTLSATPEEVMRAVDALLEFGRRHDLDPKALYGLSLALEECGSNIVNHALARDPARTFTVTFERKGSEVIVELRDRGPEFDPTKAPSAEPEAGDDRPPGGWGVMLARRSTDGMDYVRVGDENVLRLRRKFAAGTSGDAGTPGSGDSAP
ncbi:MAG: ATP-binding protein [Planctomycetes bacterium]|jgi:anti-sigma regulatory factor (Ser/Thr protein kinase)|nr:ATP-binding protein [Planctomycetota bacterium]